MEQHLMKDLEKVGTWEDLSTEAQEDILEFLDREFVKMRKRNLREGRNLLAFYFLIPMFLFVSMLTMALYKTSNNPWWIDSLFAPLIYVVGCIMFSLIYFGFILLLMKFGVKSLEAKIEKVIDYIEHLSIK